MFRNLICACVTAATLAGCGSVTPAGLIAASRLDPIETPPSDITVALGVPSVLQLRDGDATLHLSFAPEDPKRTKPVKATVPLSISKQAPTPRVAVAGEAVYVLGFAPKDAVRLAAVQKQMRAIKAQEIAGKGTLAIDVIGGCLTGDLGGSLPVSTWPRTDPSARWVALTSNVDLIDVLAPQESAQLLARLTPC